MSSHTLAAFLLARIAEDEKTARNIHAERCDTPAEVVPDSWGRPMDPSCDCDWRVDRVLAECEAKRRIVEAFEDERQRKDIYNRDFDAWLLTTDGDFQSRVSSNARWAGLEIAVRALTSVYADHPDYQPRVEAVIVGPEFVDATDDETRPQSEGN